MLDALQIQLPDNSSLKQKNYWISGADVLRIAQYALDGINTAGSLPQGQGTWDKPWLLDGDSLTWMALAKELRSWTANERYFRICGRIVKKCKAPTAYYMVDAGGTDGGRAWDQKIVHDKNRGWIGVDFERGGPSYRNFANYMDNIRRDSSKPLTEEQWSQHKAEKMRRVLMADQVYEKNLATKSDWSTGQLLPVLAATMFLAEPARNIRAFLANKILLDMMQLGMTYGGRKKGSSPKSYVWSTALLRDPQDKGGKMPAAMSGSADAGKIKIAPNSSALGTGFYTQAKELTLICRYLTFGVFTGTNEGMINKTAFTRIEVTTDPGINKSNSFTTTGEIAGYLKYLLQYSVSDWRP